MERRSINKKYIYENGNLHLIRYAVIQQVSLLLYLPHIFYMYVDNVGQIH